jgi:UDP-N-acetylmuramyl tripeptide synthase
MSTSIVTPSRGGILASSVVADAKFFGPSEPRASSITARLDSVRPGDLFVVLPGRDDSLADVQAALDAGASLVVSEQLWPLADVPQLVVDDARAAYGELCQALVGNPATELPVVGIAGTHGKTSVALLVASILKQAGHSPSCFTNRINMVSGDLRTMPSSTEAASIAHNLGEAVATGSTHVLLETDEKLLASHQLAGVPLDLACITNLYADNTAGDSSPEESRQRMLRVVDQLAPHGVLVANADDADCQRMLATYDGAAVTFAQHRPAEVVGRVIEQHAGEQSFLLTIDGETAVVTTRIVGTLHVNNCLAAAAIATTYGVSLADIAGGLAAVERLPGVMQRIASALEFATYVDGGNSPESLRACLAGVRSTTGGRLFAVVPGQSLATFSVAQAMSDQSIDVTGWSSLPADVRDAIVGIVGGGSVARKLPRAVLMRMAATASAVLAAEPGDAIVIAGCRSRAKSLGRLDESVLLESVLCTIAHLRKAQAA